jgi:hypothetical protein
MYTVSDEFKIAIAKPDRTLKSRITFSDLTLDDSNITSIRFDGGIIASDDFEIGTAIMKTAKVDLIDIDFSLNSYGFENKEALIEIGVMLEDESFEYVPIGLFTFTKAVKDNRKITLDANDRMYKFEKPYVSTLTYPKNLLQIAQEICSLAGVTLKNTSFVNSTYTLNSIPVLQNVTLRQAIAFIAELAGGYSRITRDGKLEIFNINTSVENIIYYSGIHYAQTPLPIIADDINLSENVIVTRANYINFDKQDYQIARIDKVIVQLGSETATEGSGSNTYYVVDNLFCQNPNSVIEGMYEVLNGVSYMPFNMNWQGNPAIDPGDMITIQTGLATYNTIATSISGNYQGGYREDYKAVGKSNIAKESTPKGSLTLDMKNAKTEIKVLDGKIEQRVTQDEFETYVEQTAETLTSKVSRGTDLETEVTQNAESWNLSINGKLQGTNYNFTGTGFTIGGTTGANKAEHTPEYSKYIHSDGTYTQISADGLKRFVSGVGKSYFYTSAYIESGNLDFSFTTGSSGGVDSGVSMSLDLPSELIGKSVTVVPLLINMSCITTGNFMPFATPSPSGVVNTGTNKVDFLVPVSGFLVAGGSVLNTYQNTGFTLRVKVGAILIA